MKTGGGSGSSLSSVLTHPITIGTLGGAALGGGIGYLTTPEEKSRRRGALTGAGAGALLGGLGGIVASSGKNPDEVESIVNQATNLAAKQGYNEGAKAGFTKGHKAGMDSLQDRIIDTVGPDAAGALFQAASRES